MDGHTKGRWIVRQGRIVKDTTVAYQEPDIVILKADREPGNGTSPVERDENIKRAALCVNLLDGVSSEDIKRFQILLDKNPELLKRGIATYLTFVE